MFGKAAWSGGGGGGVGGSGGGGGLIGGFTVYGMYLTYATAHVVNCKWSLVRKLTELSLQLRDE